MQLELWDTGLPASIAPGDSKGCVKCHKDLPLSAYSFASGGNYLRSECKKCALELSQIRKRLYDTATYPGPDYVCPICNRDAEAVSGNGGKSLGPWVLDHCHNSNVFRGWLCHKCNRALGAFEDNTDRLAAAMEYLSEHQ